MNLRPLQFLFQKIILKLSQFYNFKAILKAIFKAKLKAILKAIFKYSKLYSNIQSYIQSYIQKAFSYKKAIYAYKSSELEPPKA